MIDVYKIQAVVKDIVEGLPEGLRDLPGAAQSHLQQALADALARLDVVTRETFDVQAAVLQKTRKKVEALESRVAELEKARG